MAQFDYNWFKCRRFISRFVLIAMFVKCVAEECMNLGSINAFDKTNGAQLVAIIASIVNRLQGSNYAASRR